MKTHTFLIFTFCSFFYLHSMAMADTDMIQLPNTVHSYSGGNVGSGSNSIDGNFDTYYELNVGHTTGSTIVATHTFPQASLVTQIDFKFYAHCREYGDDTGYVTIDRYVSWYNGSTWAVVPGSDHHESRSQYHDALDIWDATGPVSLTGLNLVNCSEIKAYVRVIAYNNKNSNSNAQAYIYEIQAWAPVTPPAVSTLNASGAYTNQTTLNGIITDTGGEMVVERAFEWGTSSGSYPNFWTESSSSGFGAHAFSHLSKDLSPQTTFYFRAKARNSIGWGYGQEESFTLSDTLPVSAISVNGGEICYGGRIVNVDFNNSTGNYVKLNYSTDGGVTFSDIDNSLHMAEMAHWQVPVGIDSDACVVQAVSPDGTAFLGISEAFSIKPCSVTADLTGDCFVNMEDLIILARVWMQGKNY